MCATSAEIDVLNCSDPMRFVVPYECHLVSRYWFYVITLYAYVVLNVLTFSQEGFFAFVTVHLLVVLKYISAFLLQLREWLSGALINTCIPSSRYEISYSSGGIAVHSFYSFN